MINEDLLRKKLGEKLAFSKNNSEFEERTLMSKWVSFYSIYQQSLLGRKNPLLALRKQNLADFYSQNTHIAHSLEKKLMGRMAWEQKMLGDPTDQLGIFFASTCYQIRFWSSLMRHVSSSNYDLAAKETISQIQKSNPMDSQYAQSMELDIKTAMSSSCSIMGPKEAMLSCQQALLPVIEQDYFELKPTEDLYTSQKISALKSLKINSIPHLFVPKTSAKHDSHRPLIRR